MTGLSERASAAIAYVAERSAGEPLDRNQRITLNFHPDRLLGDVTILQAMRSDAVYRSQYETGTSNGGLTAHPGGDRWQWEHRMFGGVYDDAPASERPKYGALNHLKRTLGGAPRFGSACFVLEEHMVDRTTFCYPDSTTSPRDFGTAQHFDLFNVMTTWPEVPLRPGDGDPLDRYVEAHIHGTVSLTEDVAELILDPCFEGTDIQKEAERLGVTITWHEGRVLTTERLSELEDYRGLEPVRVGHEIAEAGHLDARVIGQAVQAGEYAPQTLKQLWHLTAQWGSPRREGPDKRYLS